MKGKNIKNNCYDVQENNVQLTVLNVFSLLLQIHAGPPVSSERRIQFGKTMTN